MLLVMGLGTQMVAWPEEFCRRLAGHGFFVIRYDNRDVGRSTHLRRQRPPTIRELLLRDKSAAKYSLADMAADGIGLLDRLGIERAHVVGASMGGMIAQTMAARRPDRVLSLASIMSNTGHVWKGTPGLRLYPIFLRRPASSREGAVESFVSVLQADRLARLPVRRGGDAQGGRAELRPRLRPGRHGPPARGDHRRRQPDGRAARHHGADRRDPRHQGQDGAAVRRPRHRRRHPGRATRHDRGHGPRPAARRLGQDGRRHRGERGARRRFGPERRARVACRGWSPSPAQAPRRSTGSRRSGCCCTSIIGRSEARRSGPTSTTSPPGASGASSTPASSATAASCCSPSGTAS